MNSRFMILVSAVAAMLMVGCAPQQNHRVAIGRNRGTPQMINGQANPAAMPKSSSTQWGEITQAGGEDFQSELYYLTYPQLSTAGSQYQLGAVSGLSGQSTGVRFWGYAQSSNGGPIGNGFTSGAIDPNSAVIHLEIWDQNSSSVGPVYIQIDPSSNIFVSTSGSVMGNQAQLVFTDTMGSVYMNGVISGANFTGTISYSNDTTAGQQRTLGQFSVATCGFFKCQ